MKKILLITAFVFSSVVSANTVEREELNEKIEFTECVKCNYTSQYTWYRAVVRRVFTLEAGYQNVVEYEIDKVCTNCYSFGETGTTVTTTCVNY